MKNTQCGFKYYSHSHPCCHIFVLFSHLLTYSWNCGISNELFIFFILSFILKRCCVRTLAVDIKQGLAKQFIPQSDAYLTPNDFIMLFCSHFIYFLSFFIYFSFTCWLTFYLPGPSHRTMQAFSQKYNIQHTTMYTAGWGGGLCGLDPRKGKEHKGRKKCNGGKERGDDKKVRAHKRVLLTLSY